jgi:hypothetical protein
MTKTQTSTKTDTDDGETDLENLHQEIAALFTKQRQTIARLRARIERLNGKMDHTLTKGNIEHALVLMDSEADMSLTFLKPKPDPDIKLDFLENSKIKKEIEVKLAKIKAIKSQDKPELWMYFDSGASRSVISTTSPIRKHLKETAPTHGSCSIGNGTPLQYIEKGKVKDNLEITVVEDLKYDLFSSVSAAKKGLTSIIDYDLITGKNNSYTIDKTTGNITPLIERGKGILELPLHLMISTGTSFITAQETSQPKDELTLKDEFTPNIISMFWHHIDDKTFDLTNRENNNTEYSLFTFDIIKSLSERERDFLIHARLGHLPR